LDAFESLGRSHGAAASAVLLVAVAAGSAAQAQEARLSDIKAYAVESVTRQTAGGGKYMPAFPNAWSSFVEVQATLQPPPAKGDATVALSRIGLEARYGKEPWTTNVWAVGTKTAGNCRYLAAAAQGGRPDVHALPDGASLSLTRANTSDPGTLTVSGKTVVLCLLFAPPKGTVGPAAMTFDGQRFALGDLLRPQPESTASRVDFTALAQAHRMKAAVALGVVGVLLLGWFALRRFGAWRQQAFAGSTLPSYEPEEVHAGSRSALPPIDAPTEAPSALQVGARHCRTVFALVAPAAGPGRQDFEAGQRALQVKSNRSAEQLLARALESGLDPTFACGAWAFRGKAALRLGRGEQAIRCFLAALACEQVTQQATHLASSHLAVIYRELGWRDDARFMERVTAASGPADIVRDKRFVAAVRKGLRGIRPLRGRSLWERLTRRKAAVAGG
jgi:hypothetical protein